MNATTTKIATLATKYIALPTLALTTALTFGLGSAAASPLSACGPQQTQVGSNSGKINVTCTTVNNKNSGVQNTGSNNGTNVGATTTSGTGNNTANGNQVQGNGNVIVGGGNTVQGNTATNVNGSGNTVTNVNGVGNTVNSNNTSVTNVTQVQNKTTFVDAPPAQPQVVVVQQPAPAPAPAPAPETVTVVVTTDLGLSIDRGLGATYAAGDALGIGWVVSRPMQVEIALVRPEGRLVVYSGTSESAGNLTTAVPGGVQGVMLVEMTGTATDGSTAREMVWFTIQ